MAASLLGMRRLDADPWLPTAVGAAIEVHAEVLAARGDRPEAVAYLRQELAVYSATSIGERIRKNINLLDLEGKPAPPLETGEWLGTRPPSLASLRGHPVLLFFWAHWCVDCKAEGPILASLVARYAPKGLVLVAPTRLYGNRVDVNGTLQVLLAARQAGVRRVVFSGSSAVYGEEPTLPKREDMAPDPISPYGVSKLVGELYGKVFHRVYGLEFVSLRYFNVFGPRQDPGSQYSGVLSLFITAIRNGTVPIIYGDGEQSRDFTFVENVVQANLRACEEPKVSGLVFNAGTGKRYTLNQTLRVLENISGRAAQAKYAERRPGDIRDSQADISLAREKLGYDPQVGFEEGLRRTWDWYCAQHESQSQ